MIFRDEDWSRLKKIGAYHTPGGLTTTECFLAEGNPDEEKIGAFGVGEPSAAHGTGPSFSCVARILQPVLGHG